MHTDLREFLSRWIGTMAMAVMPVVFVAFVSLPMNLHRHPGEAVANSFAPSAHMT